ncbi:MAG: hypothetical protein GX359_10790 [Clostridiales bacterium]|nr:hypothetical protein [Clostridiales bacterium]
MDYVVQKIVALGVPGIVLLVAMGASGWVGAAAITTALAALGGPFGMLGGIAVLGILVVISDGLAKYGFEKLLIASVKEMERRGVPRSRIIAKIRKYPISLGMKNKIIEKLSSLGL